MALWTPPFCLTLEVSTKPGQLHLKVPPWSHADRVRSELEELKAIPQDLEEQFGPYVDDPVGFVGEVLGAEPQPYQIAILEAAADNPRIAWRAGHGLGKTTTLSWLLLWWLCTRPYSRVLVLAPAFERQVGRYLFPEVRKWARNAPEPLPVKVRANTVEVIGFERDWFAIGIQATDSSKVEGAHAENLLVLADEAKGLDAEVIAALHGTQTDLSGDRLYVLASVPGGPSGPFYDVFRKGSGLWNTFHTRASESSLVSRTWIEERALEWGEQSPLYLARVEGEFPDEAEGTLFRLADLEAAVGREIEHDEEPRITFGVDIARYGDDRSAIGVWRGNELLEVMTRRSLDTMQVAS